MLERGGVMAAWTLDTDTDAGGLARLLRELATAIETGRVCDGVAGLPPRLGVLELVAERRGRRFAIRLRATAEENASGQAQARPQGPRPRDARQGDGLERAREKYRQLKKAMQRDYKALERAAAEGRMPAPDEAESFLALCEAMADTAQPVLAPHGAEAAELDRANRAFVEEAQALRRALSARDAAALAQVLERLERRRKACHAQYR
jgi:XXXCH domain-containing protein